MQSNFTKKARAIQFADLQENRFRVSVRAMGNKELQETFSFVQAKLEKTHERFIYVRDRLTFKVNVMRGELMSRKLL